MPSPTTTDLLAAAAVAAAEVEMPRDDLENNCGGTLERARWVLNAPEPPSLWHHISGSIRGAIFPAASGNNHLKKQKPGSLIISNAGLALRAHFPILKWCRDYRGTKFKKDLMAGLTLASLSIPQSIGYATLAKIDPQYGLYGSAVPPLIYAVMGTSKEIAIGPVAVVSLLLSSMIQKIQDPIADPVSYRRIVFTVTFFAGIFQAAFGLFRLGFLVDFLSHAAIVGFMGGAAIVIGLQQLKGLLGVTYTSTKTDIISVTHAVLNSAIHHPWSPFNFILGSTFLVLILLARIFGRKNKKYFWVPAIAPLVCVILSTLIVFLTRADEHGVKIVKHIKGGLNPISVHQLEFTTPHTTELVKIGLVVALVALTEAIAVGRSFATIKGYHLDGNKEMVAMGVMNITGSFTSCYAATGSFSRTAVNFSAGCETPVSNIVMAITVLISLQFLTKLLYYTPTAILASIILSALPGLIDIREAKQIWKLDKLDFLTCAGAFFGVLFGSVEIGLIVAVAISFAKIVLSAIRPGIEGLGRLPQHPEGSNEIYVDAKQYPAAAEPPKGVLVVRTKSPMLCFANSNSIRERIMQWVTENEDGFSKENGRSRFQLVILDISNLVTVDTSGIASLEELHKELACLKIELAMVNPNWEVLHKLRMANLVSKIGGRVFLTVAEAMEACHGASTKIVMPV